MINFDEEERAEVGRALGHDLFRFTRWGAGATWPRSVQEGFGYAQSQRLGREHSDRFQRKWLQLRLGALTRGLPVDAEVTPQLLREIDVTHCPVTREVLTHGERLGSDWSVDRLNNDGAYAPNNLAVMSTRANAAKSDRSFEQVLALSVRDVPAVGLLPIEWLRLAGLMLGPCFVERPQQLPLIPLLTSIPARSVRHGVQLIQHAFATRAATSAGKNALVRQFRALMPGDAELAALRALAEAVNTGLKGLACPSDVWLDGRAMAALTAWRWHLDSMRWAMAGALAGQLLGARPVPASSLRSWHLGAHAAPVRRLPGHSAAI